MTIPTITITGNARPPDNNSVGGKIRATLSAPDFDSASNIVVDRQVTALIGSDGGFSINLWPNSRGSKGTHYLITMEFPPSSPGYGTGPVVLGEIRLNESLPTRPLASILTATTGPTPIIILPSVWADFLKAADAVGAFYGTVAAGMAVTANDGYFFVSTGGGLSIELWRRVANVATPVRFIVVVTG